MSTKPLWAPWLGKILPTVQIRLIEICLLEFQHKKLPCRIGKKSGTLQFRQIFVLFSPTLKCAFLQIDSSKDIIIRGT